jgi:HSP20 family protein
MADRPDPFSGIEQFVDEFMEFGSPLQHQIPVDVVDSDEELIVLADLPGRDPADINVQLEDNRTLHLAAGATGADHEGRYVTRERGTDAVDRTLGLHAAVNEGDTEATYDDGVLTVRLPKLTGESDGTDIPVN